VCWRSLPRVLGCPVSNLVLHTHYGMIPQPSFLFLFWCIEKQLSMIVCSYRQIPLRPRANYHLSRRRSHERSSKPNTNAPLRTRRRSLGSACMCSLGTSPARTHACTNTKMHTHSRTKSEYTTEQAKGLTENQGWPDVDLKAWIRSCSKQMAWVMMGWLVDLIRAR
jgi:hypothetical protein